MKFQASFSGFGGAAITIYSVSRFVQGREVLIIAKAATHKLERFEPDAAFLTDSSGARDADMVFKEDRFMQALEVFRANKDRIVWAENMERYSPDHIVEIDGFSGETGKFKYRIDGLTNGHAAVLATALRFATEIGVAKAEDMLDRFSALVTSI